MGHCKYVQAALANRIVVQEHEAEFLIALLFTAKARTPFYSNLVNAHRQGTLMQLLFY